MAAQAITRQAKRVATCSAARHIFARGQATAANIEGNAYERPSDPMAVFPPLEIADSLSSRPRKEWQREDIQAIYDSPLMDLIFRAVCFL